MIATVHPSAISGIIAASPSKSVMQRACALALLNNGSTLIRQPGISSDDLTALHILKAAGAMIEEKKEGLLISSDGEIHPAGIFECNESGLSVRMFTPILALSTKEITVKGRGSLLNRSLQAFDPIMPQLGVEFQSAGGYLPFIIRGPLIPSDITIDGGSSSQYLTGLLFAFGRAAKQPVTISVINLKSRPYIDLSLQMLRHFGYEVLNDNYEKFTIQPKGNDQHDIVYTTEGDWSGAACLFVAAAIAGKVSITGLSHNSVQADTAIIEILRACGATISVVMNEIKVEKSGELKPFIFDASDCPDLFPPLVVLAANCKGRSVIKGVSRLVGKESNRAATLHDVFSRLGINILIEEDEMIITGGRIKGGNINGYNDHRIVMAAAIAALTSESGINISGAEAVNKSYPHFFDNLLSVGGSVSLA